MKTIPLDDLDGKIIFTNKNRWLKIKDCRFYDEFGRNVQFDSRVEQCERILDKLPSLKEGQNFHLSSNVPRSFGPYEVLVFKTDEDFRFRIRLTDYRLTIPFMFRSTDVRVGEIEGNWSYRSGRLVAALKNQNLSIAFDGNIPILYIGFSMSVKSESISGNEHESSANCL